MNFGYRTPNIKKSVKSRTTGKITRTLKKSINPTYSNKGVGYIKNPEKAIKNSIYHKTTIDITKPIKNTIFRNSYKKQKKNNVYNTLIEENSITKNTIRKRTNNDTPLSPTTEKLITIISYIIATIIIGFIVILIISFIIGIIQGIINN